MTKFARRRRNFTLLIFLALLFTFSGNLYLDQEEDQSSTNIPVTNSNTEEGPLAIEELEKLSIHPAKNSGDYRRDEFGKGWTKWGDCNTRQRILGRDLEEVVYDKNGCKVLSGKLNDPYTGKTISFTSGQQTSTAVQIDHVVALANAWETGAQYLSREVRQQLANDDLELIAVDGPANQEKGSGDASEWLPQNKDFHCQYIARQIAVKIRYGLWVTQAEHDTMSKILQTCPQQTLPI